MHLLSNLFFVAVAFGAGVATGYTVRMNLPLICEALRGGR